MTTLALKSKSQAVLNIAWLINFNWAVCIVFWYYTIATERDGVWGFVFADLFGLAYCGSYLLRAKQPNEQKRLILYAIPAAMFALALAWNLGVSTWSMATDPTSLLKNYILLMVLNRTFEFNVLIVSTYAGVQLLRNSNSSDFNFLKGLADRVISTEEKKGGR